MKIGIVGAGTVGGALGSLWAKRGHTVIFGTRLPSATKIQDLLAESGDNASAATYQQAIDQSDVVVIALRWPIVGEILPALNGWQGKIVIDATNRITPPEEEPQWSAGEAIAHMLTGAKVVKAFNTIGQEHYANPVFDGQTASMFICGDELEARQVASDLASELGFAPVNAGPLSNAGLLESLAKLWIYLGRDQGRDIAFKLLRR